MGHFVVKSWSNIWSALVTVGIDAGHPAGSSEPFYQEKKKTSLETSLVKVDYTVKFRPIKPNK